MGTASFIDQVRKSDIDYTEGNLLSVLWNQYERIILESLIKSFGLNFLLQDRDGGNVDSVHNVREDVEYKNKINEVAYDSHGKYNKKIS